MADDLRAWVAGQAVQARAEQDATGAAVAAASRTVRRHLATALLVAAGLLLGVLLGHRFLAPPPSTARCHVQDVLEEVASLERTVGALAARQVPEPVEAASLWRGVETRIDAARTHAGSLPEGPDRERALATLEDLAGRTDPPRLEIETQGGGKWSARSGIDGKEYLLGPGPTPLPPGPYTVHPTGRLASRIRIPVLLPLAIRPARSPAPTVTLRAPLPRDGVPEGMVYVAPGPPGPGEADLPAFLIGTSEVTCADYVAFLDDVPVAEARDHVPEEGFRPDPGRRGRYLVDPEYEDRPVTGIRPADTVAFASWRSSLVGIAFALPTDAQWRRAAGGAHLEPARLRFFHLQTVDAQGRVRGGASPFGARALLAAPAEYVHDGESFVVKGAGGGIGIPPTLAALRAGERVGPLDRVTGAGFRLVRSLR
ncbi:MAG: formylglycine-generating enzyme family protein [Planctomycetota bacterium]